jgi:broad specificity phosphatase PhoE
MAQHIYLMRHGQSMANAQQIVAGSHESSLSPLGVQQAEYAGDTARQYYHFDLIVTSPLSRAVQTANIVAQRIGYPTNKVLVMDDLRERDLGEVEGMDYRHAPQHNGNYEDAENVPGVEPIGNLLARLQDVLERLRGRPEQNILIIAHNGCGRMLRVAIRAKEPLAMYQQPRMDNAIIYTLS